MKKLTAEWVQKAEDDLVSAQRLARGRVPLRDQVCFHCQQSAEKYLKALLEERGLTIPRTHQLLDLLSLLSSHQPTLRSLRRGLDYTVSRAAVSEFSRIPLRENDVAYEGRVPLCCRRSLSLVNCD